jgi:hypothetical protein
MIEANTLATSLLTLDKLNFRTHLGAGNHCEIPPPVTTTPDTPSTPVHPPSSVPVPSKPTTNAPAGPPPSPTQQCPDTHGGCKNSGTCVMVEGDDDDNNKYWYPKCKCPKGCSCTCSTASVAVCAHSNTPYMSIPRARLRSTACVVTRSLCFSYLLLYHYYSSLCIATGDSCEFKHELCNKCAECDSKCSVKKHWWRGKSASCKCSSDNKSYDDKTKRSVAVISNMPLLEAQFGVAFSHLPTNI